MTSSTLWRHSHCIPEEEVLLAEVLATKGEQRLYNIVEGQPNDFSFNIPFDRGRIASVEFSIDPITSHNLARHNLYSITGRYITSHEDLSSDQVLERAQVVYNTYIRVIQLKLDEKCFQRHPCQTLLSPPASIDLDLPSKLQTHYGGFYSNPRTIKRKAEPPSTADYLTKKIIARFAAWEEGGRKKRGRKKEGRKPLEVSLIYQAIGSCVSLADGKSLADGEEFGNYIQTVAQKFHQTIEQGNPDSSTTWMAWMFVCCLHLVGERIQRHKHAPSQAAKLFNSIINKLIVSEGVAAMEVYQALAGRAQPFILLSTTEGFEEQFYKATYASRLSSRNIEFISATVAKNLHGRMPRPGDSTLSLSPVAWLSILLPNITYTQLWDDIGLPNLKLIVTEAHRNTWNTLLPRKHEWKESCHQFEQGDLGILEATKIFQTNILASSHWHPDTSIVAHPEENWPCEENWSKAPQGYIPNAFWDEDKEGQVSDLDQLLGIDCGSHL